MTEFPSAEFADRSHCINCASTKLTELSRGMFMDSPLVGFIEADPWGESPLPYLKNAEWVLAQCDDCDQVFHRRILTDVWNEKRFSKWMSIEAIREFEARAAVGSPAYERKVKKAHEGISHILSIEKLTRSIRNRGEGVRLLEFGCGSGDFLLICKHVGAFEAYGVDRSAPRRDHALVNIFPSLNDLKDAPPFHAITLFEVLEHLDNPAAVLTQLSSLLRPNGILVLETPDCTGVTGIQSHTDYLKIHPLDHINAFTNKTLKSIAERHGFTCIPKCVAHVTADRIQVIRAEAKHLLGRDVRSTQLYFRKA